MSTFQRARSEEQREERRRSILQTAAAMLDEMPVSAMSLNELSRRVGLAKSNVLRYFESREAVLLDLLADAAARFRAEAAGTPAADVDPSASLDTRAHEVAAGLARSFAAHPVLCELLSAQTAVLEHNVSTDVAIRYKRAARDGLLWLAELLRRHLPELDEERSVRAASMIILLVGALWTHSRPGPAVLAAFETDASLAFMHPSFTDALENAAAAFLLGLAVDRHGASANTGPRSRNTR